MGGSGRAPQRIRGRVAGADCRPETLTVPPELFIASMMGGRQNCSNLQQSAAGADYMANDSQNSVRVTTTLTRQQHADLENIAEQNGVKVAWLVRRAVENLIEQAQGPLFFLDIREGRQNA
ncbi:hypothetical protein [Xanthomonas citri]|nr:hypothetical protein [Xanthomonas citri]MCC8567317.1 hypothetical protein [Xanthomonas citri pv. fuscans]